MKRDRIMIVVAVAGAVVFLILALGFLYTLSPFANTSNNLQLLSIGLTFVTSVLLIGIYTVLAFRQGSQNRLQKGQQKLMEASHEPILQVVNIDSYLSYLWLDLRNIGNGPMTEVKFKLHLYIDLYTEDERMTIDSEGYRLNCSPDAVDAPVGEAAQIGSLAPGQTAKFSAVIRTPRLDMKGETPLGNLVNTDRHIKEMFYQIEIYYDHLMRTKGTGHHFLTPRKVNPPMFSVLELEGQRILSVESLIHGEECTKPEIFNVESNFREPGTYYDDA